MTNQVQKIDDQSKEIDTVTDGANAMAAIFERAAFDQTFPLDRLEKMMEMQERWEAKQAEKAFDKAMAAAKADLKPIERNAKGHNSKKYADLSAIAEAIDPIITAHGLSYRYETNQDDKIHVTCVLSHEQGHKIKTTIAGGADNSGSKNSIQAIGSTLTYLQRYSLIQALGLSIGNDDDGQKSEQQIQEPITETQFKRLQGLIEETETEIAKFCQVMKIESLKELPSAELGKAERLLEAKAEKMKGKSND